MSKCNYYKEKLTVVPVYNTDTGKKVGTCGRIQGFCTHKATGEMVCFCKGSRNKCDIGEIRLKAAKERSKKLKYDMEKSVDIFVRLLIKTISGIDCDNCKPNDCTKVYDSSDCLYHTVYDLVQNYISNIKKTLEEY